MGGRKSLRLRYDAAVILTFCLVSFLVLIFDQFVLKNVDIVQKIFSLPGTLSKSVAVNAQVAEGAAAVIQTEGVFNFQNPAHYFRLLIYIFGSKTLLQFLISFAFILPIGAQMEEIYGHAAIGIMILVTTLVTGVLNACLIPTTLCGAGAIAFMLILLSAITSLSKNELPLSAIFIFALYVGTEIYLTGTIDNAKLVVIFAKLAGGLCGSMFGFLTAPKAKRSAAAKTTSASSSSYNREDSYGNTDATKKARESFMERIKKEKAQKKFDDETTVVGSINI